MESRTTPTAVETTTAEPPDDATDPAEAPRGGGSEIEVPDVQVPDLPDVQVPRDRGADRGGVRS